MSRAAPNEHKHRRSITTIIARDERKRRSFAPRDSNAEARERRGVVNFARRLLSLARVYERFVGAENCA